MKKLFSLLLCTALVLGLCACGSSGAEGGADNAGLQAGFSRLDCIPDDPLVHIAGGNATDDPATDGLLDNLAVTCIALKEGDQTFLIYTCDIVDIVDFYKAVEKGVSGATGVPVENVILNATHTHSAPTLKPGDLKLPGAANYLGKFTSCCIETATAAIADLSPVGDISYGSIMTEDMVRVRHYRMNDGSTYGNGHGTSEGLASGYKEHLYESDPECQVIRLARTAEGKKDIVMFNLGAHATIVSGSHTSALSADFPFPARQFVEENAGVHAAYFIAAAGDQTPGSKVPGNVPNNNHFDYGAKLGQYVIDTLNNMTVSETKSIQYHLENYTAKRNKDGLDDPVRLQLAAEISSLKQASGGSVTSEVKAKIKEYGFNSIYEVSSLLSRNSAPETGFFPIGTMKLGDLGIVFFPGEMFGSQGRTLKDESPTPFTFIITCSEDDQGYYPNATGKEENFYEYQITKYEMGTGEAVVERYCDVLGAMKDGTEIPALPQP